MTQLFKFLSTNSVKKAPAYFITDRGVFAQGSALYATEATAQGYKPLTTAPMPAPVDAHHWEARYADGATIKQTWVSAEDPVTPVITPKRRMSKNKIIVYLSGIKMGDATGWQVLRDTLTQAGAIDLFLASDYIEEGDATLTSMMHILTPLLASAEITLDDMLTACNDPWWQSQAIGPQNQE